jgi:serine/threonine-protein phosphatase 2A regulatory subunit B'
MIEKNIFRCLPNVKKRNLAFSETGIEQEEETDPAWPHLQGIYEFFLQLIINEAVEVNYFTLSTLYCLILKFFYYGCLVESI